MMIVRERESEEREKESLYTKEERQRAASTAEHNKAFVLSRL